MGQVTVQKLHKKETSELNLAIRYFTIVGAIGGVRLSDRQIQLLAYTALKGTISSGGAIQGFVTQFGTSKGSMENIKNSLVKMGLIIKQDGKYQVTPQFALNFERNLVLQVNLDLKQDGFPQDREDSPNEAS